MAERSRVRFNPVTKEIEVEGSESFVKTTLDKLLSIIPGAVKEEVKVKRVTKAVKAAPKKKAGKKPKVVKVSPAPKALKEPKAVKTRPPKKVKKATKKEPGVKRVTNIDMIVGLIQGSTEGISTAELKEKTGLAERQIWSIVNRAAKLGKIKKLKRGVYVTV
jgi:outer membrane protein assembly factor BamA